MWTVDPAIVSQAVGLLQQGELVAFPTETVYGLGADASNPEAAAKIFAAKGRPADHPLIVHVPGASWLEQWARDIPQAAWDLAEAFWPGPLTLILKKQGWVPGQVTGGQDTVGLRVPAHPTALDLLRLFANANKRGGVAAPSANRFGRISPTTAAHVREELGSQVALVVDGGDCLVGIESTIVNLSHQGVEILRPGHITPTQLAEVLGEMPNVRGQPSCGQEVPRVSGSLHSHYAPDTPVRLVASAELMEVVSHSGAGRYGVLAYQQAPAAMGNHAVWHCIPADPTGYAHGLYSALRAFDHLGLDWIVVEMPPETAAWTAVWDRLRRAAYRE